jgi:hypothetical protein
MSIDIAGQDLPLFTLHTVLYPQGWLPLRVFEPRYVDMVRDCMRMDRAFGVVLIRSGRETGAPAEPHSIGTTARIRDFGRGRDGLLSILAAGESRFLIHSRRIQPNTLQVAVVELLIDEPRPAVPDELLWLADVLRQVRAQSPPHDRAAVDHYEDGNWLAFRLAESLPLPMPVRQRILEAHGAIERLALLAQVLEPVSAPH